jgi:hypothetical protein
VILLHGSSIFFYLDVDDRSTNIRIKAVAEAATGTKPTIHIWPSILLPFLSGCMGVRNRCPRQYGCSPPRFSNKITSILIFRKEFEPFNVFFEFAGHGTVEKFDKLLSPIPHRGDDLEKLTYSYFRIVT